MIMQTHLRGRRSNDETQANARLIAAAPDMLEALLHAKRNMPHPDQMIDEAIAKATGEASHGE